MKNFWPYRPSAKGFSIENLARKYREKISDISLKQKSKELENSRNLNYLKRENKHFFESTLSAQKGHWANRDFSEYRDVA